MHEHSQIEQVALKSCLRAFGQAADTIGFAKPLGAYSEAEAMAVITAVVTQFTAAMQAQHERMRVSPVRGAHGHAVADPLRLPEHLPSQDFDDDIPF
jgi:hypothetical protein